MTDATWRDRIELVAPVIVAMAVAVAVAVWFHGAMPGDLQHRLAGGAFHAGHVWCVDHIGRILEGSAPASILTDRVGFPEPAAAARCLIVVPAVVTAPLRAWLGPLAVYNVLLLGTPAVAVLFVWLLARRVTDLSSAVAAAAGIPFAVSPYVLGCFSGGQTCKAQVWTIACCLWALSGAVRGPWRPLQVLLTFVAGVLTAYTEPTYAVIVPLVAAPWALVAVRRPFGWSALGAVAGLGALAAGLWTAKLYYDPTGTQLLELFEPASRVTASGINLPSAMAQPEQLVLGPRDLQIQAGSPNHVTYLGLPLLIALAVGTVVPWRGRALAWVAVVVGVTVALGEWLVTENAYLLDEAGRGYRMPAWWLASVGYPLSRSVMYYRAAAVASLGVALGAMGVASRMRHGWILAWALAGAAVWDTHRVLGELWPVRGHLVRTELYERMNADPVPGAVVQLPLVHDSVTGAWMVFDNVFVGRAESGLIRHTQADQPNLRTIADWLTAASALPREEASQYLFARGVRYIVVHRGQDVPERPALYRALGAPMAVGGREYWRVGPAP